MADGTSGFVTELQAVRDRVQPGLRGLEFLARLGNALSPDDAEAVRQQRDGHLALVRAIDSALVVVRQLQAAGYPAVPVLRVPPAVIAELRGIIEDEQAALALFVENATPAATALDPTVTLAPK